MEKGDFHIHSKCSDGVLSMEEIIELAKVRGMKYIAITDHDNTGNYIHSYTKQNSNGIMLIPGMELSTTNNGENIHVLGYFTNDKFKGSEFQGFLKKIIEHRKMRGRKIIENLDKYFDIKLDYEKITRKVGVALARPHIAKAIIEAGYPYTFDEVFQKLIGNDSPAYVPNMKVTVEEGLELFKSVNAVTVLAHPVLIKKSSVRNLLKLGFDGIEAIYFQNTPEETGKFLKIADELNLIVTAGSDFHGIDTADGKHGSIGSVYLKGEKLKKFTDLFTF